ncbi:uncharacterized protein LACBIDRAFT_331949 [Laccaria bicolor S238N-H82]|uniref:Predicted protein n=1 Tax=Laccaria bicolor (strain S238N-H82 / ATCC MYA-4686) TaxID=486041 RepID=B0DR49_LACBS|nr:uncharacterized protein LACBIDRAFT_331949 [Laccaria bicolor S238N-H82]EDR02936.1 predicted protein [Laccaria bicolor S238N-H82]|eukprot:XP_001886359.1 predicted protein [Laccaria bicolor S238N-H82]
MVVPVAFIRVVLCSVVFTLWLYSLCGCGSEIVSYWFIWSWSPLFIRPSLASITPRLLPRASTSFFTQFSPVPQTAQHPGSSLCGPRSDDDEQQIGCCSSFGCHVAVDDVASGLSVLVVVVMGAPRPCRSSGDGGGRCSSTSVGGGTRGRCGGSGGAAWLG